MRIVITTLIYGDCKLLYLRMPLLQIRSTDHLIPYLHLMWYHHLLLSRLERSEKTVAHSVPVAYSVASRLKNSVWIYHGIRLSIDFSRPHLSSSKILNLRSFDTDASYTNLSFGLTYLLIHTSVRFGTQELVDQDLHRNHAL